MPHSRFWPGVSRRVQLFAGLGLAAVLLATLVALQALPLQAQSLTTLVSNTHLTRTSNNNLIVAQSFETGANAGGYTVSAVGIKVATGSGKSTSVKIKENDANDKPGALVATLDDRPPRKRRWGSIQSPIVFPGMASGRRGCARRGRLGAGGRGGARRCRRG